MRSKDLGRRWKSWDHREKKPKTKAAKESQKKKVNHVR